MRVALAAFAIALVLAGCASAGEADVARAIDVGEQNAVVGEIPTAIAGTTNGASADASGIETLAGTEAPDSTAPQEAADNAPAAPTPATAEPTAVPPTAVPPETAAPRATPTTAPAPEPTATTAPTPEPTATLEPTATPVPSATPVPGNTRATPDGDSNNSPRIIALSDFETVSGALSVGINDADYYQFFAAGDQELIAVEIALACTAAELDDATSVIIEGPLPDGELASGQCNQAGTGTQWATSIANGGYQVAVRIGQRAGVDSEPFNPSDYDPTNGFAPFAAYQLTVTPRFAEVVDYQIAPDDGDGPNNPTVGRLPTDINNVVSAPDGDTEDWFRFTGSELLDAFNISIDPDDPEVYVNIICRDFVGDQQARVVATLFDAQTTDSIAQYQCTAQQDLEFQPFKLDFAAEYVVRVQMQGTGSVTYGWGFHGP